MSEGVLQVRRFVNERSTSNTYLLTVSGESGCLLVDPGEVGGVKTQSMLEQEGLHPDYALLTHEHVDHVAGLNQLRSRWPCQVVCTRACSDALCDPRRNLSRYYIQRDERYAPAELCCEDIGWKMDWAGMKLRFLATPGHSPGGLCIAVQNMLFTGDTLLQGLKCVAHLPGGNKEVLQESVQHIMRAFASVTLVCPGHGEPFLMKQAADGRPFAGKRAVA